MLDLVIMGWMVWFFFLFVPWFFFFRHANRPPIKGFYIDEEEQKGQKLLRYAQNNYHPDDYWDGEVDYDTGEIGTNTGPTIRHPKNRDRAYSGGA